MPTRLWDVHAALLAVFDAATAADVLDGPPPAKSTLPKRFVLVGSDGGDTGDGVGGEESLMSQTASTLGPGTWRDERGEIICAVWAWDGDADVTRLRPDATSIFDELEAAVQADRFLGGILRPPDAAELSALRLRETQESYGALVRAAFTVSYRALITS